MKERWRRKQGLGVSCKHPPSRHSILTSSQELDAPSSQSAGPSSRKEVSTPTTTPADLVLQIPLQVRHHEFLPEFVTSAGHPSLTSSQRPPNDQPHPQSARAPNSSPINHNTTTHPLSHLHHQHSTPKNTPTHHPTPSTPASPFPDPAAQQSSSTPTPKVSTKSQHPATHRSATTTHQHLPNPEVTPPEPH